MGGGSLERGGEAAAARGAIGQRDPRARLVAAVAILVTIIALNSLTVLVAALAGAGLLVGLARLPGHALRHRLAHVEGFMVVLLVLLPFTTPGTALWSAGPLVLSSEGLARAVAVALKVNIAVLTLFALVGALEPVRLGHAAARLGVPLKLVHLFLFVVRYVGLFQAEAAHLLEAMKARAFVPRASRHCWRSLGNLAGMMLVRSFERAERVDEAMRCRAFAGRFPLVTEDRFGTGDAVFGALTAVALATLVMLDRLA